MFADNFACWWDRKTYSVVCRCFCAKTKTCFSSLKWYSIWTEFSSPPLNYFKCDANWNSSTQKSVITVMFAISSVWCVFRCLGSGWIVWVSVQVLVSPANRSCRSVSAHPQLCSRRHSRSPIRRPRRHCRLFNWNRQTHSTYWIAHLCMYAFYTLYS